MLSIKDLHASVADKEILKGVNLTVNKGEVHVIMGPNGAGKSTLGGVLSGNPKYAVSQGEISLDGESLLEMSPEERAWAGLFLSFQYPTEIPGVTNATFLKAALGEVRRHRGLPELSASEFLRTAKSKLEYVEMDKSFLSRGVNVGFSGGEKKRNEIFQMAMLEPRVAILDETDSGLDVDALRIVGTGINRLRTQENAIILITHYQRLLDYIVPDFIHVLHDGRIIKSSGAQLAREIEEKGYDWIINN
ncbi:MAG: Fe-S cluster assembly ATPase SufC [Bacteroidales bacterium]|nr:Fe-S cluster assembly ATPase SufC [Bacteroidales bacterium]